MGGQGGFRAGQMEGVMEHLGGESSPPKAAQKREAMGEKLMMMEGDGERTERSSTYAPNIKTAGTLRRGQMKKSKTNRKINGEIGHPWRTPVTTMKGEGEGLPGRAR